MEPLLTPADVARVLGCSRSQVYALIRLGELTPVQLPGAGKDGMMRKTRFRRSDIEALIAGVSA
jgi:excisionase family DNA binding protein